jgi:MFS family permease
LKVYWRNDRIFYGWTILASFFVIGLLVFGIRFSFGVFFKSIESEFLLNRAGTSAVFSTYMAVGALAALAGGILIDKYGPRIVALFMGLAIGAGLVLTSFTTAYWQLFLTFGLLLAAGSGPIFSIISSTMARWFRKKRTLVLAIAQSGAGFGTVLMAPLTAFLVSALDWRTAYLIIGLGASVIIVPLSLLLKKEPGEIGVLPYGEVKSAPKTAGSVVTTAAPQDSLAQILKSKNFWLFVSVTLLFGFCVFLIITHLVPHATDIGIPATEAASILSAIGVCAIVARIVMGISADRLGRKLVTMVCALSLCAGMVWLGWARELWSLYLFSLAFGLGQGGFSPTMASLAGEIFGLQHLSTVMGIIDVAFNIGAVIGPLAGGLIFDASGSYEVAFWVGGGAALLTAVLLGSIRHEDSN